MAVEDGTEKSYNYKEYFKKDSYYIVKKIAAIY